MFMIPSNMAIPAHARMDAPRPEPRAKVKVKLREGHAQHMVCGRVWHREDADADGYIEGVVYQSDLDRLASLVEDDDAAGDGARRAFAEARRRYIASAAGIPADDVPDVGERHADPVVQEQIQHADATFTGSVEGQFYSREFRGMRPFADVQAVEELPPPLTQQEEAVKAIVSNFAPAAAGPSMSADDIGKGIVKALIEAGVIEAPAKTGSKKS